MAADLNRIRNPDFRKGRKAPTAWKWQVLSGRAAINRVAPPDPGGPHALRILAHEASSAFLSQEVVFIPNKWYRIETVATCDLSTRNGGLILRLAHKSDDDSGTRTLETDPVIRTKAPHVIRAFFHVPGNVRRATVSVGVVAASGEAEIHDVRCMRILEPEYAAHPFAAPVPSAQLRPPQAVKRVCICSASAQSRPLNGLMTEYFGAGNVSILDPGTLDLAHPPDGALLLPDPSPPKEIRTFGGLLKLASSRCVVISLNAFARLSRGAAGVRRIVQPDDPTYARVVLGDHATCGFALHDAFPYGSSAGKDGGSFLQNQLRKTEKLAQFCKKNQLVVMLESLCDKDATSYQPIALHRETEGGGLYVIDLEPVESDPSSMGEPVLAMHILLSMLGHGQSQLGQYFTMQRREPALREFIRELAVRYEAIRVHDAELPSSEVTEQLLTVGGEEHSFGLPMAPRPVILIRSGLTGGDLESYYGCWLWIKQLVRPLPHACPYARELLSKFRIAWVPSAAPWSAADGWRRSGALPPTPMMIETEGSDLAAIVDVVSQPVERVRLVFARNDQRCAHASRWLPSLFTAFAPQQRFGYAPPWGTPFADRAAYAWRLHRPMVEVGVAPESFTDPAHADALAAGACVIRIEVPGLDADWVANSIQRTETVATLLEQIIGLQYGLIALNRRPTAVHYDGFPPLPPGEALIADHKHPITRGQMPQAG